jgi:CheY-like chemotaxis protein
VKVLVVDPDATRAPALMRTLRDGGAEVTVAPSGSFALTMLEWNRHDVVLSRARIEDMEGHELCAILKADPGTRDVRFVLVAGPDEVSPTATTDGGVDLVLPPAMTGSAIVPLILRLMQADRVPEPAAPAAAAAPREAEAPGVPRLRPEPAAPPQGEPPKRYMTAATAAAASPWSKEAAAAAPATAPALTPPDVAPPVAAPAVATPAVPRPAIATPAIATAAVATPPRAPAPPAPVPPAKPAAPAASRAGSAPAPPDLMAIPSGTFQGSLEVMDLADLTQAIAGGGKSGRLILALPQGGGVMLFDKGRVVHAEYRNTVGEEAFGALLAASHGDGAGRFCFLPTPAGQSSGMPRTIDKTVDRLLLSSATAIDEKG